MLVRGFLEFFFPDKSVINRGTHKSIKKLGVSHMHRLVERYKLALES